MNPLLQVYLLAFEKQALLAERVKTVGSALAKRIMASRGVGQAQAESMAKRILERGMHGSAMLGSGVVAPGRSARHQLLREVVRGAQETIPKPHAKALQVGAGWSM